MLYRQNIADYLKGIIERASRPDRRKEGMAVLRLFESEDTPWDAERFGQALEAFPAVKIEGDTLTIEGGPYSTYRTAVALMRKYLTLVGTETATGGSAVMTTAEVKHYISEQIKAGGKSIEPRGVLKYIRNPEFQLLRGTLKGTTRLFTRDEADEFIKWYLGSDIRRGVKTGSHWSEKRRTAAGGNREG